MNNSITRDYPALLEDVSAQERMVTARINTSGIDRYRTVIDPAGGDLKKYNKVVLWEHGKDPVRGNLPIGKNIWLKRSGKEIIARTQFGKDEYSQALFEMYRDEMLNGWSIHVLPQEGAYGRPTKDELRDRPELRDCETIYRKWELAEYSAVAVPGNAEALSILEARGIWVPEETKLEAQNRVAPDDQSHWENKKSEAPEESDDVDESRDLSDFDDEEEDEQEEDDTQRYIRKRGNKWVVLSEEGKTLGTHDSRESAQKQLAAIEAHKHGQGRASDHKGIPIYVKKRGSSWVVVSESGRVLGKHKTREDALTQLHAIEYQATKERSDDGSMDIVKVGRDLDEIRQLLAEQWVYSESQVTGSLIARAELMRGVV